MELWWNRLIKLFYLTTVWLLFYTQTVERRLFFRAELSWLGSSNTIFWSVTRCKAIKLWWGCKFNSSPLWGLKDAWSLSFWFTYLLILHILVLALWVWTCLSLMFWDDRSQNHITNRTELMRYSYSLLNACLFCNSACYFFPCLDAISCIICYVQYLKNYLSHFLAFSFSSFQN